jgi:T-complex protein 1 subunit alpha
MRESIRYIKESLTHKVDTLGRDAIINAAKTSMSSKLVSSESDFFSEMVVSAMEAVKMTNTRGKVKYPIKAISIRKCHGQSSRDSRHINGYSLPMGRTAQGMPMKIENAKICCVDFNLNKFKLQMGVQVLVNDPKNLENIRNREMDITKERIQKILGGGANVILTSKGIDDLALKYFVEAGAIAVRRVPKGDLRRIAKMSGGEVLTTLADQEGEETFNPDCLGTAEVVLEEKIGDNDFLFFQGMKNSYAQTILIRGANEFMIDEVERSLHDSICVVKRVLESNFVVVGGGCIETALSIYLDDFARTLGSKEQLAITEFAESLLVIPKVLANNAAKDASDLLARLKAYHAASQTSEDPKKKEYKNVGLDLIEGKARNNLKAGVLEPALSKIKSLKFATEAAITILRIDDMIELAPKQQEQPE